MMFPLGRILAVFGISSPAVVFVDVQISVPCIDHWLYRKGHTRYQQAAGAFFAHVWYKWLFVKVYTAAVTAKFGNHGAAVGFSVFLNGSADVS